MSFCKKLWLKRSLSNKLSEKAFKLNDGERISGHQTLPNDDTERISGHQTLPNDDTKRISRHQTLPKDDTKRISGHQTLPNDDTKRISRHQTLPNDDTEMKSNDEVISVKSKTANIPCKNSPRLNRRFFDQSCTMLAKSLLGKILVRKLETGEILKGIIVETESYLGIEDKASHTFRGKRTKRNEAMYMQSGTAYVYSIYGLYHCFNISSLEEGSAVLIRALEPLDNITMMLSLRSSNRKGSKDLKEKDICNGPSKLCQAFKIDKDSLNKVDLCTSEDVWVEEGSEERNHVVVACKRIGIDSAGEEWANKPLRFYIKDCAFISVKNKQAEANINSIPS